MDFDINTSIDNENVNITFNSKEEFLQNLSVLIDNCIANNGSYFEIMIDSDTNCFKERK